MYTRKYIVLVHPVFRSKQFLVNKDHTPSNSRVSYRCMGGRPGSGKRVSVSTLSRSVVRPLTSLCRSQSNEEGKVTTTVSDVHLHRLPVLPSSDPGVQRRPSRRDSPQCPVRPSLFVTGSCHTSVTLKFLLNRGSVLGQGEIYLSYIYIHIFK